MITDVEVGGATQSSSNAPLTLSKISQLIDDTFDEAGSTPDSCIKTLLGELQSHSPLYKYIVNVVTITKSDENEANGLFSPESQNIKIDSRTGALWQEKKDGTHTFALNRENEMYLVTVTWLVK